MKYTVVSPKVAVLQKIVPGSDNVNVRPTGRQETLVTDSDTEVKMKLTLRRLHRCVRCNY